jgi:8-oxo-dGTP diphosphatase
MSSEERNKFHAAVYIVLIRGNKILLLERANTGYKDGYFGLPSGHIDGHESAITAAIREAKEEIGIDLIPEQLDLIHTQHRYIDKDDKYGYEYIDLYFRSINWAGTPQNKEPHKCARLEWYEQVNLPDNMVPEVRHALQKIAANISYSDFNF